MGADYKDPGTHPDPPGPRDGTQSGPGAGIDAHRSGWACRAGVQSARWKPRAKLRVAAYIR